MTKRKRKVARLYYAKPCRPDFLARLKKIYKKPLKVAGVDLICSERDRF
jgi:hypothetical protein